MSTRPPISRRHALLVCASVLAIALACAALLGAAALVPAPPAVLPLIGAVSIGCPLAVLADARASIRVLRDPRIGPLRARHVSLLRRELDRLPETEHPLGL
jgi:hypothetical protein